MGQKITPQFNTLVAARGGAGITERGNSGVSATSTMSRPTKRKPKAPAFPKLRGTR